MCSSHAYMPMFCLGDFSNILYSKLRANLNTVFDRKGSSKANGPAYWTNKT